MLKFSLFIQCVETNEPLDYSVTGAEFVNQIDDIVEYCGMHDPTGITLVTVKLNNPIDSGSYLLIKKLIVGEIELNNMQQWSAYVLADGSVVPLTNGWIDRAGEYRLKLRYNPIAQNYISYLLSICPKSQ